MSEERTKNINILTLRHLTFCSLVFLLSLAYFCIPAFALDEDITDKYPSADQEAVKLERSMERTKTPSVEKLEVSVFADLQQGFDNNVELNSKRRRDGFLQNSFSVDLEYAHDERLSFFTGTDLFSTIYYNLNDNNILDVAPYAGMEWEVTPDLVWTNKITYDYFSYPNERENTFNGLILSTYLRQYLRPTIYHEAGYEYVPRWYPDRKTFNSRGFMTSDDREDKRHRIKYNIGFFSYRFFFRLSNELRRNDSNDMFQDYYDYWMYRLRPSLMIFITDRFYSDFTLIYKFTAYDERRSTEDINRKQKDNTYLFNASLFYDINNNVTLGVTYSYSENDSNDPYQEYSGSIITGGLYYSF